MLIPPAALGSANPGLRLGLGAGPGQSMSYFGVVSSDARLLHCPLRDCIQQITSKAPTCFFSNCKLRVPSPAQEGSRRRPGARPEHPAAGDTLANAQDFPFFHKKGWNVLYVDGHAQWVDLCRAGITPFETGVWGTSPQLPARRADGINRLGRQAVDSAPWRLTHQKKKINARPESPSRFGEEFRAKTRSRIL